MCMKKLLTLFTCAIFTSGAFATAGNPGFHYRQHQRFINPTPPARVVPATTVNHGVKNVGTTPLAPPVNPNVITRTQYKQLLDKEKAGTITPMESDLLAKYRSK